MYERTVILKALKGCQKIRSEDAASYAPAYILQKVWLAGLDHWTTKALREAFAKDLSLNILVDADVSKLRDTIRQGLQGGHWDMKVGDRVFIKTDDGKFTLPDTIEFSDRMVLYRRGILQPPKPSPVQPDGTEIAIIKNCHYLFLVVKLLKLEKWVSAG